MLSLEDIRLIEPYDEIAPWRCQLTVVESDQRIEVPIHQISGFQVALLTILLAVICTPICYIVYAHVGSDENRIAFGILVSVIWILGVIGPAAFWLFWPIGFLRPDHWIRFDRDSNLLSIRGGYSIFHLNEIIGFLSVTDLRRRKRVTEFQVITCDSGARANHFVSNCRELNPELAFGHVIKQFGRFSKIPYYFATIDSDGYIRIDGNHTI